VGEKSRGRKKSSNDSAAGNGRKEWNLEELTPEPGRAWKKQLIPELKLVPSRGKPKWDGGRLEAERKF